MGGGYRPLTPEQKQQEADLAALKARGGAPLGSSTAPGSKGANKADVDSTMVIDNRKAAPGAKDFDATTGEWVEPEKHSRNAGLPKEKLDPTLTDLLLRDLATGQVRRTRAGSRRATFGGSTMNPYDTPTLGG